MIELNNLSGGYSGEFRLQNISLTIPGGAITAVIGPNGSGKSTLLRLICGLRRPDSGQVLLGGRAAGAMSAKELAQTVSILPQNRPPASILAENLVLHGRFPYMGYPRRYREADRQAARQAMAWAGVLPLAQRNVATLSGGERQKVYIAMLLAQDTPIVLMDEPTNNLDMACKFEVMGLARQMKDAGKTVVMVLHDLELALSCADRVALLEAGRLRACAAPEELYRSGMLEAVFGIRVQKVAAQDGPVYAFRPL